MQLTLTNGLPRANYRSTSKVPYLPQVVLERVQVVRYFKHEITVISQDSIFRKAKHTQAFEGVFTIVAIFVHP